MDRDTRLPAPIHLDGSVFNPKTELRWLGLWFTPSLFSTHHFTKQLANAQAAFVAVKRLSTPGMGLPPVLCHNLAASLLFPILSYRGHIFHVTGHIVRKLVAFLHRVQRWCKNSFACRPTNIVPIEAWLTPLDLLLVHKRQGANLRVRCSPRRSNRQGPSCPLCAHPLSQWSHP